MYHYGDEKMDFAEAALIAKVRLSPEDLDRYFAPDIALAIKTIINGLDNEIRKAKEGGYIKGCMDTEKEKNKIIEKLLEERKTMWVKGKPEKSGNYKVRYHGNEGRDDYTTSDGGHWWNTGSLADQGEVEYDPDSFREL